MTELLLILATIVPITAFSSHLSWQDALNPLGTTYSVYRGLGACSSKPAYVKLTSGLSVLTYTDSTPPMGAYCYAVTATNNGQESDYSSPIDVTIPQLGTVTP